MTSPSRHGEHSVFPAKAGEPAIRAFADPSTDTGLPARHRIDRQRLPEHRKAWMAGLRPP